MFNPSTYDVVAAATYSSPSQDCVGVKWPDVVAAACDAAHLGPKKTPNCKRTDDGGRGADERVSPIS